MREKGWENWGMLPQGVRYGLWPEYLEDYQRACISWSVIPGIV